MSDSPAEGKESSLIAALRIASSLGILFDANPGIGNEETFPDAHWQPPEASGAASNNIHNAALHEAVAVRRLSWRSGMVRTCVAMRRPTETIPFNPNTKRNEFRATSAAAGPANQ